MKISELEEKGQGKEMGNREKSIGKR